MVNIVFLVVNFHKLTISIIRMNHDANLFMAKGVSQNNKYPFPRDQDLSFFVRKTIQLTTSSIIARQNRKILPRKPKLPKNKKKCIRYNKKMRKNYLLRREADLVQKKGMTTRRKRTFATKHKVDVYINNQPHRTISSMVAHWQLP